MTNSQEVLDEFLSFGGFPLFSNLLSVTGSPGAAVLAALINCSCSSPVVEVARDAHLELLVQSDQLLLYPQLMEVVVAKSQLWPDHALSVILKCITGLISENNTFHEFNIAIINKSDLVNVLMTLLHDLSSEETIPIKEISILLNSIPPSAKLVSDLISLSILITSPSHLYLPNLSPTLASTSISSISSNFVTQLHKQDVVDVSLLLEKIELGELNQTSSVESENSKQNRKIHEECQLQENYSSNKSDLDLEYFEREEDIVSEWDVWTPNSGNSVSPSPSISVHHSPSPLNTPLLSTLLSTLVSGFTLLPDSTCTALTETTLRPEILFAFINHPAPGVHSPAIILQTLVLQRCPAARKIFFSQNGGYQQVSEHIYVHLSCTCPNKNTLGRPLSTFSTCM